MPHNKGCLTRTLPKHTPTTDRQTHRQTDRRTDTRRPQDTACQQTHTSEPSLPPPIWRYPSLVHFSGSYKPLGQEEKRHRLLLKFSCPLNRCAISGLRKFFVAALCCVRSRTDVGHDKHVQLAGANLRESLRTPNARRWGRAAARSEMLLHQHKHPMHARVFHSPAPDDSECSTRNSASATEPRALAEAYANAVSPLQPPE